MRMVRGARVMPLVNLGERPMKTKFGMKTRSHFEIVDWKTPGDRTCPRDRKSTPQQLNATASAARARRSPETALTASAGSSPGGR